MQPFNLEKALAGAPLVTRDGREVTSFEAPADAGSVFPYLALADGIRGRVWVTPQGRYNETDVDHHLDLFMVANGFVDKIEPTPSILEQAQKLIYGDRQADYGSVTTNFTNIAKGWEVILGGKVTPEQVGLCMAWVKIARQSNKPKHDNLVDIAGYIGCIDKLKKGE
jgi:hypothetical protein